jgi:hypothetical protein
MRTSAAAQAAGGGSSSGEGAPGGAGAQRSAPAPDAAARQASRTTAAKIARSLVGDGATEELGSLARGAGGGQPPPAEAPGVPKPYTVPPGWKAPTLGEQFRYVSHLSERKHCYRAGATWVTSCLPPVLA